MNILGNEQTSSNIIGKLIRVYSDSNIAGIITKRAHRVIDNDDIAGDIHLKVELFLRFCKETGLIEVYLDKLLNGMDTEWKHFVKCYDLKDEFIQEFTDLNVQLLSCFSARATYERFKFLGICIRSDDIINESRIPFRRLEVAYFGHVLFYPLHYYVKKNSKINLYWLRRGIERVRLAILPSYVDCDQIKEVVKEFPDYGIENDTVLNDIEIIRGSYIGEIKDERHIQGYRKSLYYKMQTFPHKRVSYTNFSPEDIFDFIHKRQEKRKIWIENIRS